MLNFKNIYHFFKLSNNLKLTFRNSKTYTNRQESSADHSWHLALLLIILHPHLEHRIDLEKSLKMIVIHDLPECITGDLNILDTVLDTVVYQRKKTEEKKALKQLGKYLDKAAKKELTSLWNEFEENQTIESKVVHALDKLEAHITNLQMEDLKNWKQLKSSGFLSQIEKSFQCDSLIEGFYSFLKEETNQIENKFKNKGKNLNDL